MEASKLVSVIAEKENTFSYQQSTKKQEVSKFHIGSKRKLFENSDDSSDEDTGSFDKKVKVIKQAVNYSQNILSAYQSKDYTKCLEQIEEFFELPISDSQHQSEEARSRYRIIQAACWTMLDVKREKVFETLNEVIKQDPKNSFAHYGVGLAQYREGDFTNCMKAFETAIKYNPSGAMKRAMELKAKAKSIMELIQGAKEQFEMNNFLRAVKMLNAAARVDQGSSKITNTITSIRDQFIKDLVERLEIDIRYEVSDIYKEVEKLIKSHQLREAEKLLNVIGKKASTESGQFVYLKGFALYMKGSLKESLILFKKAQEFDDFYQKAKRMERKIIFFQELADKTEIQMNSGKYEEAIETLTYTLKVDKDNRLINQAVFFQRALANFNIGKKEDAYADYQQFLLITKIVGNVLAGVTGIEGNLKMKTQKQGDDLKKALELNK